MSTSPAERFHQATGSPHYLSAGDHAGMSDYLRELGYLFPGESVLMVEPAGEGNMNATLRVVTGRRRFIVKQSRPWVAKFPDLAAPIGRVLIERDFHRAIQRDRMLTARMPEILKSDADNYTIIIEDLGRAADLTAIYAPERSLEADQLGTLLRFISALHALEVVDFPDNLELRQLNHAHIFDLPFRSDNGFPLDALYPGLADTARPFQHDEKLRAAARELGDLYLAEGSCLLHGDYYPGSFLEVEGNIFVIDAEFAHLGRPEFDLGVLMAHLLMSRATEQQLLRIDTEYSKPVGFDTELARRFCYVEVMRRLIGIAQLPLSISLEERKALLDRARAGLVGGST